MCIGCKLGLIPNKGTVILLKLSAPSKIPIPIELMLERISKLSNEDAFLNAPSLITSTDVGNTNSLKREASSNAPLPMDVMSFPKNVIEASLFASLNAKSAIDVIGKPFLSAGIVRDVWNGSNPEIVHDVVEHVYSTPSSVPSLNFAYNVKLLIGIVSNSYCSVNA